MKKILIPLAGLLFLATSCDLEVNPNTTSNSTPAVSTTPEETPTSMEILTPSQVMEVSQTLNLETNFSNSYNLEYSTTNDNVIVSTDGKLTARSAGLCYITVTYKNMSDTVSIMVENASDISSDPYENVTKEEFYSNYTEATSYMDAYYRSQHYFLSGKNVVEAPEPEVPDYQPRVGTQHVRNTSAIYSADKNTYYVVDAYGNICDAIYKGGAYITLNEVAPYLLAYGNVPANHVESNKTNQVKTSPWKEFLRVNHNKFSGNTSQYPFEPVLPNISGCGGDYQYYEVDLGTTGTDTGGNYAVKIYNDGSTITRGAARFVYSRKTISTNEDIGIENRKVFYTYNHYNDFQEYLNYQGGFGKMFGNVTGGGTLSSKQDYNPTAYEEVSYLDLTLRSKSSTTNLSTICTNMLD